MADATSQPQTPASARGLIGWQATELCPQGLGIALLESIDNEDPTALVGLPLIHTCRLLRAAGIDLLN